MNHKFKFGDLVNCEGYPTVGVIVGLNDEINIATVCFYGLYHPERLMSIDSLMLIPHPDTIRLDWLAENDCALTKKLCDEDGDIHPTPNAVIQKQEEHFEILAATSNNIREAIDVAMAHIESKR